MRIRKVYPTDEVPHKWAHQAQAEARNPQGNLFFEGATLYSYRTSYPIAHIYTRGKRKLALVRSDRYSVSTARHINLAERAASHMEQITVLNVVFDDGRSDAPARHHAENIAYLVGEHDEALAKAKRALSTWPARYAYDSGKQALKDARAYRDYFKIKGAKIPRFPEDEWKAALARVQRIANPDPASRDKRERASARRQAKAREVLAAKFNSWRERINAHNAAVLAAQTMTADDVASYWREHGTWPKGSGTYNAAPWSLFVPWKDARKFRDAGLGDLPEVQRNDVPKPDHILLRVDGDQIHTSMGARVPVAAAALVWKLVQRTMASGIEWRRMGPRDVRIGDYPLDHISADGTLKAGCHTIPHHELARMAQALAL